MLTARLIDRVGKGIRGAPRDALVADIAPPEVRGAAFGLRQSLDTVGAFLGPLLAMGLMLLWANDFRAVFWVARCPAFLAVALLFFGVQEPERKPDGRPVNPDPPGEPAPAAGRVLVGGRHRRGVHAGALLRGLPGAARPAGRLAAGVDAAGADRDERRSTPLGAYPVRQAVGLDEPPEAAGVGLVAADRGRRSAGLRQLAGCGSASRLWGLHMGMTQGLLATMVADTAPADLRGTAYGFFNLLSGIAMLLASALAGLLWDQLGASFTFVAGGMFGGVALAAIILRRPERG